MRSPSVNHPQESSNDAEAGLQAVAKSAFVAVAGTDFFSAGTDSSLLAAVEDSHDSDASSGDRRPSSAENVGPPHKKAKRGSSLESWLENNPNSEEIKYVFNLANSKAVEGDPANEEVREQIEQRLA
jgi:hypothetical protein